MQVGADDDGYVVRLKLKHFVGYLQDPVHMQDDSPMYIFDGTFGDRDGSKGLLGDYCIPPWFQEDLMRLAGDRRRTPYRLNQAPVSSACLWAVVQRQKAKLPHFFLVLQRPDASSDWGQCNSSHAYFLLEHCSLTGM